MSIKSLLRKRRNKLLSKIDFTPEGIFLDLSCGDGQFLELLHEIRPKLQLFGVDISGEEIAKAKKNVWGSFSVSDVEALNFADKTFDSIICAMSFHHYKNPMNILKEAKRVLNDSGTLYLMDVFPKNKFSQKLYNWRGCKEDYHFEKFYTPDEIEKLVMDSNLRIIKDASLRKMPRLRFLEIKKSR